MIQGPIDLVALFKYRVAELCDLPKYAVELLELGNDHRLVTELACLEPEQKFKIQSVMEKIVCEFSGTSQREIARRAMMHLARRGLSDELTEYEACREIINKVHIPYTDVEEDDIYAGDNLGIEKMISHFHLYDDVDPVEHGLVHMLRDDLKALLNE